MRLSERCFAIPGLAYSPPWFVNAGFIVGDHTTLVVDTGGNYAAGATVHGYASIARPGNHLRVINTERHFDHVGGNCYFREKDIPIWGHSGIQRTEQQLAAEVRDYNEFLGGTARGEHNEASVFFANTQVTNPGHPIATDLSWDLGNCRVEILLTPGHTPTNLSVWLPAEGVLYTGDCLINSYLPNLEAGGPADWRQWLASLDRLEPLHPEVIVCGHGLVVTRDEVPQVFGRVRRILHEARERGHAPTASL
jgi:glyoxylase-like metal-dependent hydrolase (beta-lactamase superfamily II)